jgi:hypothetical protein
MALRGLLLEQTKKEKSRGTMKANTIQLITLSLILLSCGSDKSVARESGGNFPATPSKNFSCDISTSETPFDVDSCLVKACEIAEGKMTEQGCECDEGQKFVYDKVPMCLDFDKYTSVNRRVKEDHKYITYSAFHNDQLFSIDVYNYDKDSSVKDYHFANFMAPNFLTIHQLEDNKAINTSIVDKALQIPYIHVFQTFGDISPINQIRFDQKMELSLDAPHADLIYFIEETEFISDKDYFYTVEGCLGYCKKEMNFNENNLEINRIKKFFKGILSSDYITIKEKGSNLVSYKYDLIGRTILAKDQNTVNSTNISHKLSSFSLHSNGEKSRSIIKSHSEVEIAERKNYNWGNVVLCDNGLTVKDSKKYSHAKLVKGPNNNSAYGWLTNVTDQLDFYNGAVNLNENGTGTIGAANHGFSVFSFMKDVNVASVSLNSCLKDFDNWAPNAINENFKVVNYSYFDSLDRGACFVNHIWNDIQNKPQAKKMLWVLAAGNDKSHLNPETSMHCPQNIVTRNENALIVGGDPSYGGVTNKGRDYVDFFVKAPSTSTAAAVASSLAANIYKRYPSLSPKLVKKSLLASVKYESMSSRAGGLLDEERTWKAAKLLNENPWIDNKKLLDKLHCGIWSCVKKKWLKRFE